MKPPINWMNSLFLTLTPLAAITLIPLYGMNYGFTLYEWGWFVFYMFATGLSITGGYHRLWSHKTYKAHFLMRLFYAVWGACSCQNSILNWASDHRNHHRFVDQGDKDPYAASRGFWYSHIGWIMRNYPRLHPRNENVKDLAKDPIVRLQHRYYLQLVILTNAGIPLLLGYLHGRIFGTLLLCFLLRVVLNHHFTFFINSLAHIWGRRPYSDNNTSRDNFFLALFTYGEGYHNFHHTFQHDFRNGIRWWQFDPSKWIITTFSWVGLTRDLKRATKVQIEKARVNMQLQRALAKIGPRDEGCPLKERLEHGYHQFVETLNDWSQVRRKWYRVKRANIAAHLDLVELRDRYLELKFGLKLHRRRWRILLADLAAA